MTTKRIKNADFSQFLLGIALLAVGAFHEYLSCAISVAMLIWLLYKGCMHKQFTVYLNITSASLLCIVTFYGITAFWAVDSGMALIGFVKFLPVLLYLFVLFQTENAETFRLWLPYLAAAMTVISAIGMQIPVLMAYFSVAGRLAGFFQYSNTFALFVLVAELLVLSKENMHLLDYLVVAVLLFGILYSGSRTVFLLMIASNAFLVIAAKKGRTRLVAIAAVGVLAVGVLIIALVSNKAGVLGRFLAISFSESTFVGRLLYFRDALPVILRHPFGLGYMGYYYIQQSVQSGVYAVMFVHNDFLQLLLDVGWIPALLFTVAVVKAIFGKGKPLYKRVILSVMLLHSCFDFNLQYVAVFMLLLLLTDYKTGKAYSLRCSGWLGSALIMLMLGSLYFGVALGLAHFGNYSAAYALYPLDTRSETQLLIGETNSKKAVRLADDILHRNTHVTVAYSVKARQAYSSGDFAELIHIKHQIFQNAPFVYEEYEEYCYMLMTGIRLYEKAGDEASARICLQELNRAAREVHTAKSRLSSLGTKIKDQPTVQLPEDIEEYIQAEASAK